MLTAFAASVEVFEIVPVDQQILQNSALQYYGNDSRDQRSVPNRLHLRSDYV